MTADQINRLKDLSELLDNGTISKEEFDVLNTSILSYGIQTILACEIAQGKPKLFP